MEKPKTAEPLTIIVEPRITTIARNNEDLLLLDFFG
jgi:hypothetical protein